VQFAGELPVQLPERGFFIEALAAEQFGRAFKHEPGGKSGRAPPVCLALADSLKLIKFFVRQQSEIGLYPPGVVGVALDRDRSKFGPLVRQKLFEDAGHPVAERFKMPLIRLRSPARPRSSRQAMMRRTICHYSS
jgi:hypothetical protein